METFSQDHLGQKHGQPVKMDAEATLPFECHRRPTEIAAGFKPIQIKSRQKDKYIYIKRKKEKRKKERKNRCIDRGNEDNLMAEVDKDGACGQLRRASGASKFLRTHHRNRSHPHLLPSSRQRSPRTEPFITASEDGSVQLSSRFPLVRWPPPPPRQRHPIAVPSTRADGQLRPFLAWG